MDLLNQLITILRDIAGLTFNEARELAEDIIGIFNAYDDNTTEQGITIQQLQQVVQSIEAQSINTISSRIVQSQQVISSQLAQVQNNIINFIRTNILQSNTQTIQLINAVRTDIDISTQIIRNQVITSEANIRNQLAQIPNIFQRQINTQTELIVSRLNQMSTAFSQAIVSDIRSEQEIAARLNNTLNTLFANLPDDIATELYERFSTLLEQEDETPLENLLPQIQEIMKNALIDSFDSNEFKRAIHPQENNIMEFIRTIFSGVDATTNAVGEIIDFSSDTGSLIMRLIQLSSPDTLINMAIQMAAEPFLRHIYHKSSRIARSDLLTVEQLLSFYLQDRSRLGFVQNYMRTIGYSEDDINILMTQVNRPLTEDMVQQLFYRNEITGVQAVQYLRQIGYTDEGQNNVRKLWDLIPPIQDIIRMAVRDVFNPNAVREFGLDENMPQEFVEQAAKQGLNQYWTEKYWQAHWNLPSMTQGYEMFQRQIIDENQLKLLMQALDIPPLWRDYLIQMNYSAITRVDVRRMHDMGFLTYDEMVKRYRDVGYSPQDAQLISDWTVEYNNRGSEATADDTKRLTVSVITRGFVLGLITQEQALSQLTNIGYSVENAQYLLDLANLQRDIDNVPDRIKDNYRRIENILSKGFIQGTLSEIEVRQGLSRIGFSEDDINAEITFLNLERETQINGVFADLVRTRFTQYQISEQQAISILAGNGFNQGEISALISQWNIVRIHRSALPSKTEIQKMLEKGIIDLGQAENYLRGHNYPEETILQYTMLWTQ